MTKRIHADLNAVEGKLLPGGVLFPNLLCVAETDWRDECDTRQASTCNQKTDRTKVFNRASLAVRDKQEVACRDEMVWLTHPGKSA